MRRALLTGNICERSNQIRIENMAITHRCLLVSPILQEISKAIREDLVSDALTIQDSRAYIQLWPKVVGHLKNIINVKNMVLIRNCTEYYDLFTLREYNTLIFRQIYK